jgi:hypothetical protein
MLFMKARSLGNRFRTMSNQLPAIAMPHSLESQLPAKPHSAEFLQKISPTPHFATQHEIQVKISGWHYAHDAMHMESTPRYAA